MGDHPVLNWFYEFQRDKFSVEDASHSGRSRITVTEQGIDTVRVIIQNDPQST